MAKWQYEIDVPDFGERRKLSPDDEIAHNYIEVEDGGRALIYHVEKEPATESGFFVHLRSWAADITGRIKDHEVEKLRAAHPEFNLFAGRRVRITVETLDEYS